MSGIITLNSGREKSLLRQHPWIFTGAIKATSGKLRNGDTVEVQAANGQWLGRGAWSGKSQIQVRIWTFREDEGIDDTFFLRRIDSAMQGRAALVAERKVNAYRIVAAESDYLPGVTIDRYGDVLVCQLLSAGADRQRDKIVSALRRLFPDCAILERSDVAVREKEGLLPLTQVLHGEVPEEVVIEENGLQILASLKSGHKTGFYLDQRDNRAIIAGHAAGQEVLNCFSYTGAIALYCLMAGAAHVTNLDLSEPALALARRNLALNALDEERCDQLNEDVFKALRTFNSQQRSFGLIVLDPPKFAESKQTVNKACRGYKDINRLAMQLTRPGGILCTFSCSGLIAEDLFQKVVADAALDAGRQVQFLSRLGQAGDHPVASSFPEGFYLKGFVCRVL
ncbi:MAG: class I SAM-dependent methyltransferase [Pseudomonadales bacterium]|nr:class I SAM-dependent methyltransferase [Pseudomonadales bacterium]